MEFIFTDIRISKVEGKFQYQVHGKRDSTILHEVWSNWKPTLIEAIIDFQRELEKSFKDIKGEEEL